MLMIVEHTIHEKEVLFNQYQRIATLTKQSSLPKTISSRKMEKKTVNGMDYTSSQVEYSSQFPNEDSGHGQRNQILSKVISLEEEAKALQCKGIDEFYSYEGLQKL